MYFLRGVVRLQNIATALTLLFYHKTVCLSRTGFFLFFCEFVLHVTHFFFSVSVISFGHIWHNFSDCCLSAVWFFRHKGSGISRLRSREKLLMTIFSEKKNFSSEKSWEVFSRQGCKPCPINATEWNVLFCKSSHGRAKQILGNSICFARNFRKLNFLDWKNQIFFKFQNQELEK